MIGRYINSVYVRDFYTALFDPNDFSLSLTKRLREQLYLYSYQTGLLVNLAAFMLHPQQGMDIKKYTKEYKYEAKDKLSKINKPYLFKQDFSYKVIKTDYFENWKKDLENPDISSIYKGDEDVDDLKRFIETRKLYLEKQSQRKGALKRIKMKLRALSGFRGKNIEQSNEHREIEASYKKL